jgi:hypothetical protein
MTEFADGSRIGGTRSRSNIVVRRSALAAVLAVVAIAVGWDSSNSARPANVTLLYVGAADCAPCRVWQSGEGARFRASAEFASLTYREIKSPTLRDVLNDELWPDDLRWSRDRLGRNAGVPLWLVIADHEIIGRGFGMSQWRAAVLPQIRSLVR